MGTGLSATDQFLGVHLYRPSALTSRALSPQRARRTGLGGKDEHATSTFSWSKITRLLVVRAGARASLQIDLKDGLGEELLVVDLGNLGDHRPSTRREFRSRVARSIGTVANHLHHLAASCYLARVDHLQVPALHAERYLAARPQR